MDSSGKYSCVVDAHPRFHLEAFRWYACLTKLAGVNPKDLFIHVVDGTSSSILSYLAGSGPTIVPIESFSPDSPHCNKISSAIAMAHQDLKGSIVMTDTDVVILKDARAIPLPEKAIALKLVDTTNPPLRILRRIFDKAGVRLPEILPLDSSGKELTVAGNGNGGLYVVPSSLLKSLADAWSRWARWLLSDLGELERWRFNVDQISMTLALADLGISVFHLDARWNCPIHAFQPQVSGPPFVVHYHDRIDEHGLIAPSTGSPAVDASISSANAAVLDLWIDAFPGIPLASSLEPVSSTRSRRRLTRFIDLSRRRGQ